MVSRPLMDKEPHKAKRMSKEMITLFCSERKLPSRSQRLLEERTVDVNVASNA